MSKSYKIIDDRDVSNPEKSSDGCFQFASLPRALEWCKSNKYPTVWIVGGAQIYSQSLSIVDSIFLTRVKNTGSDQIKCDTFLDLNILATDFRLLSSDEMKILMGPETVTGWQTEGDYLYEYQIWVRN